MILRYNDVTKVKFKNDKAEIIVKCKYKLIIIMRKNKVIAKFGDNSEVIEFKKFNTEEIAKKIYSLIEKTGEFDIEVIKDVVQNLRIGKVCGKFMKKLGLMAFEEGDKVTEQFEKFINQID